MPNFEAQDLTRGWNAASNLEPFDNHESSSWKEGYRLWHARGTAQRIARRHPIVSHVSH